MKRNLNFIFVNFLMAILTGIYYDLLSVFLLNIHVSLLIIMVALSCFYK